MYNTWPVSRLRLLEGVDCWASEEVGPAGWRWPRLLTVDGEVFFLGGGGGEQTT